MNCIARNPASRAWGYQNPWRLEALGAELPRLDLARIVARAGRPTASSTTEQRLVTVFLWQHGRLERFLRLVAARDRAAFKKALAELRPWLPPGASR